MVNPETGHANLDENTIIFFLSKFSKYKRPSDKVKASSILSDNLC